MIDPVLIARTQDFLDSNGFADGLFEAGVCGLKVLRRHAPSDLEAILYEPLLCLILQGAKETRAAARPVPLVAGQSLIVSHHLPVVSRITEATADRPYLALVLPLNLAWLRDLQGELGDTGSVTGDVTALSAHAADPALVEAFHRLLALALRPDEAPVIGPLVARELHARALMAPHGTMLRRLLMRESQASRIARAIARIRDNPADALTVGDLAGAAGMSASSFHEHFKAVTGTTPLQYQKDLRLLEAQRLLLDAGRTVSAIAYDVGYESPNQFSREYRRKFGVPPRDDRGRVPVEAV